MPTVYIEVRSGQIIQLQQRTQTDPKPYNPPSGATIVGSYHCGLVFVVVVEVRPGPNVAKQD